MFNETSPIIQSVFTFPGRFRVRAQGAGPYIKSTLMIKGNVEISCENGEGVTKFLIHNPAFRSTFKLIYPLSLLQAHEVCFFKSNLNQIDGEVKITERVLYKRHSVDNAISHFLSNLPDETEITINVSNIETSFSDLIVGLVCSTVTTVFTIVAPIVVIGINLYKNNLELIGYFALGLLCGYTLSYLSWILFAFFKKNLFSLSTYKRYIVKVLLSFPIFASSYLQIQLLNRAEIDSTHLISLQIVSTWVASVPLREFNSHLGNLTEGKPALFQFQGFLLLGMLLTGYGIIIGQVTGFFEVLCIHTLVLIIANHFATSSLATQFSARQSGLIRD